MHSTKTAMTSLIFGLKDNAGKHNFLPQEWPWGRL